jgi:hypothetical protein
VEVGVLQIGLALLHLRLEVAAVLLKILVQQA